jgi:hypothetical protein
MEPTTSEWIDAFRELNGHPELSRIVLHRQGDWAFVAERQTGKRLNPKTDIVANTYYKTKLYNTVTYFW